MSPERNNEPANITWVPDVIYVNGRFVRDTALACDADGRVLALLSLGVLRELLGGRIPEDETINVAMPEQGIIFATRFIHLRGRAMLPGMVNAHSHAFQRVIRGRTEHRSSAHTRDSFWTWRAEMYSAAARLTPEDIYDASRMAFMEMLLSGATAVGEFHYLQRTPEGVPYDDANLLAKQVVRAARDCGMRIALLRVAYARSGFQTPPDERQKRFIEPDVETYLRHVETLRSELAAQDGNDAASAWVGVAPHSVRAVSLRYLRAVSEFAGAHELPLHMHVAEQPAEVSACLAETGRTPVALLDEHGLLNSRFTGVHAVHITSKEIFALRDTRANVCACPTTERNLGDGIVPADLFFDEGVPVALGTDSHTQIDLLEDARELEYHLRLSKLERNVLAPSSIIHDEAPGDSAHAIVSGHRGGEMEHARASNISALAERLFECATTNGARSIGAPAGSGKLAAGSPADFFTVDVNDPSIAGAGADDLLSSIVFSLARTAIREVAVGSRLVVEDGRHRAQDEIVERFITLQRKLWK